MLGRYAVWTSDVNANDKPDLNEAFFVKRERGPDDHERRRRDRQRGSPQPIEERVPFSLAGRVLHKSSSCRSEYPADLIRFKLASPASKGISITLTASGAFRNTSSKIRCQSSAPSPIGR